MIRPRSVEEAATHVEVRNTSKDSMPCMMSLGGKEFLASRHKHDGMVSYPRDLIDCISFVFLSPSSNITVVYQTSSQSSLREPSTNSIVYLGYHGEA